MIMMILGVLFVFIIPGFLLTMIFFEKEPVMEKIALIVVISIGYTVVLGILLGFNKFTYRITGGLGKLWWYVIISNLLLLAVYILKWRNVFEKKNNID